MEVKSSGQKVKKKHVGMVRKGCAAFCLFFSVFALRSSPKSIFPRIPLILTITINMDSLKTQAQTITKSEVVLKVPPPSP